MEIAITIIVITSLSILGFISYKLLETIKELAKLLKSDNLQEYIMSEKMDKENIDVWQDDPRYQDISEISDEDLKNIDIFKTKTEKFN